MRYFWILLVSLTLLLAIQCQLKPQRIQIIDQNQQRSNFLVRGNLPINQKHQFQSNQLKGNLTKITGLKNYKLIVVSMLNFLTAKETKNRYIEQRFFEKNAKYGQYRHKLILGSLVDPFQIAQPTKYILQFIDYFLDIDEIEEFIEELRSEIHDKNTKTIVYFHCSAGVDRTGYVSGSYQLKYLGKSMKSIMEENIKIAHPRKSMHFNVVNGLKWFCLDLNKEKESCKI